MTSATIMARQTQHNICEWFENDLLPRLIKENVFEVPCAHSMDLNISDLTYQETKRGIDHFASVPYHISMVLQDRNNTSKSNKFNLMIKFITQNAATRRAIGSDIQFYNEMVFYNEILPAFNEFLKNKPGQSSILLNNILPFSYYAEIDLNKPDHGVIVMNDLCVEGYKCSPSMVELDLDHCLISVKKLAQLHAVSYAMKLQNPDEFKKLASKFTECRYQTNNIVKEKGQDFYIGQTSLRGINYLMSQADCEVPLFYLNKLKNKVSNNMYQMMQALVKPEEPIAIICHGDFCRNNILFLMENDKPVDCKLFDYQTWRYANPSIDLTFFMYMNTTLELREKHFDDILKFYHETLVDTISLITSMSKLDIEVLYPYKLFYKDFGDHSLFGYAIIALFLPMMMAPLKDPHAYENDWFNIPIEEMTVKNVELGGDEVSKRISQVIIDMYRRKFYMDD